MLPEKQEVGIMKILYITTIGSTMGFFRSFIKELLDQGHTVDIASNLEANATPECYREWGCNLFQISTSRSPFSPGNIKAVGEIKKLVVEGNYDIVHCHTPIAAACTRLACSGLRKKGVKVIYTAHGFHFYTGAPKKNWLIFYTVEKLCARWTDLLITINKEDYARAQAKLPARKVEYVPGVGIDVEKFAGTQIDRNAKRTELGIPEDGFLLCSVGELNANKNHETVIRAMAQLNQLDVHYMIAGIGEKKEHLLQLAQDLHLENRVHLLGYRKDVAELYKAADLFVFPSFREGLPVSVMEAMAAGLPVVASRIRGNVDMIDDIGGFLCAPDDISAFSDAINDFRKDPQLFTKAGLRNASAAKGFDKSEINCMMHKIYDNVTRTE